MIQLKHEVDCQIEKLQLETSYYSYGIAAIVPAKGSHFETEHSYQ